MQSLQMVLLLAQFIRCVVQAVHMLAHLTYFSTQLIDLLFKIPSLLVVDHDVLPLLNHVSPLTCRHVGLVTLLSCLTLVSLLDRLELVLKEHQVVSKSKVHRDVSVPELRRDLVGVVLVSLSPQSVVDFVKVALQLSDILFCQL